MTSDFNTIWRLMDTGPLSGPENMAIDEALLDCFKPDRSPPVLRLYGWNPPAFSCGRFQQPDRIIDLEQCQRAGIPVVKRITGGGVIFHSQELTYALVCPAAFIPGSRSVKSAFFHLTSFLLAFYRSLGLSPCHAIDYNGRKQRLGERTPLCFAGTESCDILIKGRKIGGNAQRRLKGTIFQHGSIPLRQMAGAGMPYLMTPSDAILETTTSLADEGVDAAPADLRSALAAAFRETFRVDLQPDLLTLQEQERAAVLLTP
jgi:lipoate-protein ligase A